jgi:hypothetical protein
VPWLLEGSLVGAGVVWIAVSGVATTTTELATILFLVSLGGVVALLAAEAWARRRWSLQ